MKAIFEQKRLKTSHGMSLIKTNRLPPDQQTRLSWAKKLTGYREVPEEFSAFFEPLEKNNQPFPFSVMTPSYEGFLLRFQEKLVCIIDQSLFVLNKNKATQEPLCFDFQRIHSLKFKKVLLDSSFTIGGIDHSGNPSKVDLHFNTVTEGLFWEIMRRVRQSSFSSTEPYEKPLFEELKEQSFKFASYSRNCLIPGEKVVQLIWQPELTANPLSIKIPPVIRDFFERIVFPSHVVLLTDQELVLISEDEQENRREKYGAIWQFIPLRKISDITTSVQDNDLLKLNIFLKDGSKIESMFLHSVNDVLEQLVNEIKTL